jgi:hypothetical protein
MLLLVLATGYVAAWIGRRSPLVCGIGLSVIQGCYLIWLAAAALRAGNDILSPVVMVRSMLLWTPVAIVGALVRVLRTRRRSRDPHGREHAFLSLTQLTRGAVFMHPQCPGRTVRLAMLTTSLFAIVPLALVFQQTTTTFAITDADGGDTVAVEQLSRTPSTVTGDVSLPQQQAHVHYVLHLGSDGIARSVEVINDARNFFTGTIAFDSGSREPSTAGRPGTPRKIVQGRLGARPVIGISVALFDQIVRVSRPALGDSVMLPVINIRNRNEGSATIKRISADSVRIYCDGCMNRGAIEELRVAVGKDGAILGGTSPSQHWVISRR